MEYNKNMKPTVAVRRVMLKLRRCCRSAFFSWGVKRLASVYGGPTCQDKIGPILRNTEKFERVPRSYLFSTPFTAEIC